MGQIKEDGADTRYKQPAECNGEVSDFNSDVYWQK